MRRYDAAAIPAAAVQTLYFYLYYIFCFNVVLIHSGGRFVTFFVVAAVTEGHLV